MGTYFTFFLLTLCRTCLHSALTPLIGFVLTTPPTARARGAQYRVVGNKIQADGSVCMIKYYVRVRT